MARRGLLIPRQIVTLSTATPTKYNIASTWCLDGLASDIYRSVEFQKAFAHDQGVLGDTVYAVVSDKVLAKVSAEELQIKRSQVLQHLFIYTGRQNRDSIFYDNLIDIDIQKVYYKAHDIFGNEY